MNPAGPVLRCLALEVDREGDEATRRDAAQDVLARLAGAGEDDQKRLLAGGGEAAERVIVSVAQPSARWAAPPVPDGLNGTISPYTIAPCTDLPSHNTRNRTVIVCVELPTTPG